MYINRQLTTYAVELLCLLNVMRGRGLSVPSDKPPSDMNTLSLMKAHPGSTPA